MENTDLVFQEYNVVIPAEVYEGRGNEKDVGREETRAFFIYKENQVSKEDIMECIVNRGRVPEQYLKNLNKPTRETVSKAREYLDRMIRATPKEIIEGLLTREEGAVKHLMEMHISNIKERNGQSKTKIVVSSGVVPLSEIAKHYKESEREGAQIYAPVILDGKRFIEFVLFADEEGRFIHKDELELLLKHRVTRSSSLEIEVDNENDYEKAAELVRNVYHTFSSSGSREKIKMLDDSTALRLIELSGASLIDYLRCEAMKIGGSLIADILSEKMPTNTGIGSSPILGSEPFEGLFGDKPKRNPRWDNPKEDDQDSFAN